MYERVSGKGDHKMFRSISLLFFVAASVLIAPSVAQAEVDAAAVNRAIDRGIAYLRKTQSDRGGWDEYAGHSCGLSSLCTLALLNAGVSRDDPVIKDAMKYLRATVAEDTYSVALQTLVFCHHGSAGDLPRIRNNVSWLTESQKPSGVWGYGGKRESRGDPSNAQFALLALGAAQDRGVLVEPEVFERAIEYWTFTQNRNGGWSYFGSVPSGSMTCAGIASLIIANGRLGNSSSTIENGKIECCGGDSTVKDPIARGLDWLAERFSVDVNPSGNAATYYYYLYAVERAGRLSGRRFFGGHDWYREGAEKLIAQQDNFQGYWSGGDWERPTVATSFALLFLSKGKRQVVVGQLQRDQAGRSEWQPHPDSLRQLIRHIERAWGRDLTWQTVQFENASLVDLLQTPVLVISGKESLTMNEAESNRLKDYVDQGGTILFDASGASGCGNAANFQNSVTNLCAQWFPNAPLERLPASHPVWNAERNVDIDAMPNGFWVYGVQACCRTAVFYVPQSLTCRWELGDRLFSRGEADDPARLQIDHSIRIGQNILAYATGRELKDKLDDQIVLQADAMDATDRGTTRIARLDVGAGGEDARRALPNASTIIRNQTQIAVSVPANAVGFDEQDLAEVSVLWVHGRRQFELTSGQRESLRQFIERGGVIFGTAICGDEAFAQSFRKEFAKILGDTPLKSMPADHPMLTMQYYGYDLRSVTIRRIAGAGSGQSIRRQTSPPILEYAEVDGVVAVVFSPLDLSCALESQNSVQCPGYGTEDAAKIVTNIVQMALNQ
jgi:hypothetical protein